MVWSPELSAILQEYAKLAQDEAQRVMNSASSVISAAKVEHVAAMLSDSSALPGVPSVLEDFNSWATKTRSIRNLAEVTRAMSQATRSEIDYNVLRQHLPA